MDIMPMLLATGIVVGIGVLVAVVGGIVVGFTRVRRINRLIGDVVDEANRRYPNQRLMINKARFFGQESQEMALRTSAGTLVITDSELVYMQFVPRQDYTIPLKSIRGIETPSSFLGKNHDTITPLLKVNFQNDAGQPDSMAWYVDDLGRVKSALEGVHR